MSSPMGNVEFVDNPPPAERASNRRDSKYEPIAAELRERPGVWARVLRDSYTGIAHAIYAGKLSAFRPVGAYEARAHRGDDGSIEIYARYVGEDGAT